MPGEQTRGSFQLPPSIDLLLKFAALPGVAAYAVLFLAYRRYYSTLGVRPEDAGVDNSYVLSRSLGLASLVALFVALAAMSAYLDRRFPSGDDRTFSTRRGVRASGPKSRLDRMLGHGAFVVRVVLLALLGAFLTRLYSPELPKAALACALLLVGSLRLSDSFFARFGPSPQLVRLAVSSLVGVIIVATALNSYAHYQASRQALSGCHVRPLEFFGITILDISATDARISWIGAPDQRPSIFPDSSDPSVEGLIVGRGGFVSFLVLQDEEVALVQLPSNLVATRVEPGSMEDLDSPGDERCADD